MADVKLDFYQTINQLKEANLSSRETAEGMRDDVVLFIERCQELIEAIESDIYKNGVMDMRAFTELCDEYEVRW